MECGYARLTVCFDAPFWVGVYEREEGNRLTACRYVFGPEPSDAQVYQWLLSAWRGLAFGPAVAGVCRPVGRPNPKRVQRQARRDTAAAGIGTRAQQALQLQREQQKQERAARNRRRDAAEAERRFRLRQKKKKETRRGH